VVQLRDALAALKSELRRAVFFQASAGVAGVFWQVEKSSLPY
jgi:hypothetical protein